MSSPATAKMGLKQVANHKKTSTFSYSWNIGDKIYDSTPTAGGYTGWICVTAGTPGTWKGFGLIQQ